MHLSRQFFMFYALQFSSASQGRCERDAWGEWLLSVQREIVPQQWRHFQEQTFRLAMNCLTAPQLAAGYDQQQMPPQQQMPHQQQMAHQQQMPPQPQMPHPQQQPPQFVPQTSFTPQQGATQQPQFLAPTPPMQRRSTPSPQQVQFIFIP